MKRLLLLLCLLLPEISAAEDWPAHMHDAQRSGVSPDRLDFPLRPKWVYRSARSPRPAWTESPAKHDHWHKYYDLKPHQGFDRCFNVAVVGHRVYFGSTVTDAVTCLDNAAGGRVVWTFFTEGPVRFAPHVVDGKVYFGSDDGWVYCVKSKDGSLVWKTRAGPSDAMLWGNQRMISVWPVRGSVTVADGAVYWSAGLFPKEGLFLCKRDAATGKDGWTVTPRAPIQGYLLTTSEYLIAPTGKTTPNLYDCASGRFLRGLRLTINGSWSWALTAPDPKTAPSGRTRRRTASVPKPDGQVSGSNSLLRNKVTTIPTANVIIADNRYVYYNTDVAIVKRGLSERVNAWKKPHVYPYALIKAGDHLIAGGKNAVAAIDGDGTEVWRAGMDGNVYGLAVAGTNLFVSTDSGRIYAFESTHPAAADPSQPE